MVNNYFRFKQFTIYQDKVAFKVGTDGVLLGASAWVSETHFREQSRLGVTGVNDTG
jgi:tRNA1Val (adenine37-N6)-methyltransferase